MNILITGAKGFVGKNLCAGLKNIRDGKDKTRPNIKIDQIFEQDRQTDPVQMERYCAEADFVFHLAGVNRAETDEAYMQGNMGAAENLLAILKKQKNTCPVMIASSVQASCVGRYDHAYGKSKKAEEELAVDYAEEVGAKVLIYRFPNIFGKWCRPDYNSVIATFCHKLARDLPITVHDETTRLELLYIDDLVAEMLDALEGKEHPHQPDGHYCKKGRYCAAPLTYDVTLGEIADLLEGFQTKINRLILPEMPDHSFSKKLYSTYLSYLPKEKVRYGLKSNADQRGSFTELFKTEKCGQFSVNITLAGATKGQHWHHSKWEIFWVVSGHGRITMRKIGTNEVLEFDVCGEKPEGIRILPGYAHKITNLSKTENLVTLMWANEPFDPEKPDTFSEKVEV